MKNKVVIKSNNGIPSGIELNGEPLHNVTYVSIDDINPKDLISVKITLNVDSLEIEPGNVELEYK